MSQPPLLPRLQTPLLLPQRWGEGKKKKARECAQELEQWGIKNQLLARLIVAFDPQRWERSVLGHAGRGKAPNSRLCISLSLVCSRLCAPSPA